MISYFERDVIRVNHAIRANIFGKIIGELESLDSD